VPTEAQLRARKKQDATRERVSLWLTLDEAAALDQLKVKLKLSYRIDVLRRLVELEKSKS
jgi:hypothetical protein